MNEQNHDEAKERKFQERFERISRRRFVQAAATVAAGMGTIGTIDSFAQDDDVKIDYDKLRNFLFEMHSQGKLSDRCANTLDLLLETRIVDLFFTPLYDVLDRAAGTISSTPHWSTHGQLIKSELQNKTITLYQLFTSNLSSSEPTLYTRINDATADVADGYIVPFTIFDNTTYDPQLTMRRNAKDYLDGYMPETNPPRSMPIRSLFYSFPYPVPPSSKPPNPTSTWSIGRLFIYTKLHQLDPWQAHVFRLAKKYFVFSVPTTYPPLTLSSQAASSSLSKGQCAYLDGDGLWKCMSGSPTSMCGVAGNYPLAGSDLCPH